MVGELMLTVTLTPLKKLGCELFDGAMPLPSEAQPLWLPPLSDRAREYFVVAAQGIFLFGAPPHGEAPSATPLRRPTHCAAAGAPSVSGRRRNRRAVVNRMHARAQRGGRDARQERAAPSGRRWHAASPPQRNIFKKMLTD